jgi:hypothetical protein
VIFLLLRRRSLPPQSRGSPFNCGHTEQILVFSSSELQRVDPEANSRRPRHQTVVSPCTLVLYERAWPCVVAVDTAGSRGRSADGKHQDYGWLQGHDAGQDGSHLRRQTGFMPLSGSPANRAHILPKSPKPSPCAAACPRFLKIWKSHVLALVLQTFISRGPSPAF